MKYWRYKAFDAHLESHEGVVTGACLEDVALKLRQRELQLLELSSVSRREYNTRLQLGKHIKSLQHISLDDTTSAPLPIKPDSIPIGNYLMVLAIILLLGLELHRFFY